MLAPCQSPRGEHAEKGTSYREFLGKWLLGPLLITLVLDGTCSAQPGGAGASALSSPAAARQERLKQRDAYAAQTAQLRARGKPAEAIAAAGKMLAIEREIFGNIHAEVAGSLEQLTQLHTAC